LEDLAIQLVSIQNSLRPRHERKLIVVCAGDHGVVEEGVSPYPSEVTIQQIANFQKGGGAITSLGRAAGAEVVLLDVGIKGQLPPHPGRIDAKIAMGTKNMAKGPAMSRREALLSVLAGLELVLSMSGGVDLVTAGEMGIGNTTASSAIVCALTGMSPGEATGTGSGLPPGRLAHKAGVIGRALEVNKPDPGDPIDVLAKVGGFEIGAMAGVYLGGAMRQAGVVIDGFIGAAAALLAEGICPGLAKFLIAGHRSREKAHGAVLERLGLTPLLDLGLWLGEGSGAAMAFLILKCACAHYNDMSTLAEAGVSDTV
jgi:nicotinate-nucleotide--dimethylbenzimidazole phosphoribosyltransferase